MAFLNLPGVQVNAVDGGLVARRIPRTKATLIIGTADKGPADQAVQVIDRAAAALSFGFSGNLVRAMEEVASYCDNLILFRMGTKPLKLNSVGLEFAAAKTISNVAVATNVATITTSAAHGYVIGDIVKVAAVTNTTVNGTFVVASVPLTTTFTYAVVAANASGVDTGSTYKQISTGFNVEFGDRVSTAATDYKIWYKDGVLAVWKSSELQFSNDPTLGSVDTGDVILSLNSISAQLGLQLGSGANALLSAAVTIQAASVLSGTAIEPTPTLTAPVTGIGLTGRQTYVALAKALDLLGDLQVQQIYSAAALLDQENIAHYVASDTTTVDNNPVTNANALDWIKVTTNTQGDKTYQWANDVVDSEGTTVSAMGVVADGAARQAAGFYEASFGYLLANFCEKQAETQGGCIAFIGTQGPKGSYRISDTHSWVGFLPTYGNANSTIPTVAGKGLLGLPVLVGTTASKLHPLCTDKSVGRAPGMFRNSIQQYDGGADLDINQNPIDIGSLLHVVGDRAIMTNGFRANYEANIAGLVAGLCSALDEKSNLTNKKVNVIQLWKPTLAQMDALTFAKVNVLRFKGLAEVPVLLHGVTAASAISDYNSLLRVRIRFMVAQLVFEEGDKFIGESTIDGLQLTAMTTALENRAIQLQKRGYVSFADFKVSTTDIDRRIGHARVDIKFSPADELVQLTTYVGIARR